MVTRAYEFHEFYNHTISTLIENIPLLDPILSSLSIFAITFFFVYFPVAIIMGWQDYKKYAVPVDATIAAKINPWVNELSRALMLIYDNENEKAKENPKN